jgi:hypothetical protein
MSRLPEARVARLWNILGHDGQKKPWILTRIVRQKVSQASGGSTGVPRGNEVIRVDGANVFGKICVPSTDGRRLAGRRGKDGRVAAWVISQLPGKDVRIIDEARDYSAGILLEEAYDGRAGVEFVMCLCNAELLNVNIHTA